MTRFFWLFSRSPLGLVLVGILLAALLLFISTLTTVSRIDHRVAAGQAAALRASTVLDQSRLFIDSLGATRTAFAEHAQRGDAKAFETYVLSRARLRTAAQMLITLHLGEPFDVEVRQFLAEEEVLFDERRGISDSQSAARWDELDKQSRRLVDRGRELVATQHAAAANEGIAFERALLAHTIAAVPLGVACLEVYRRRLAELERERAGLVCRVSHELKTPLTAIRQGVELLADPAGTPRDEAVEIGRLIRESSIELQRLVEGLLELGKSRALADADRPARSVNLKALLQRIVGEHALVLRSKRLNVRQDLGEATVRGDSQRLRAALSNVLANAVKYTPADGEISVRLAADDEAAIVDVADTGPGISAEERALVFEPFFQGRSAASSHVKGTGLGLAIAKDCVESHNGCIEIVESERGAHFRVRLPVA